MKLRKMYLVSPDTFNYSERPFQPPPTSHPRKTIASRGTKRANITKRYTKRNLNDEWVRFREEMREADATEQMQVKTIADFLKKVLPDATSREALLNQALSVKMSSNKRTGT
jgi:hypothetical protein